MRSIKTKLISAVLVAGLLVGLAGCGKDEVKPTEPVVEPVVEVLPENTTPTDPYEGTWFFDRKNDQGKVHSYLTGQWVDESVRNTRPVAFMVENTKEALPHYGISEASIIYEAPVEGSITRLMCIFEDAENVNLERIGNVRSARPYYINSAIQYDAILCHAGQSIHAQVMLEAGAINNLNGLEDKIANAMFFRTSDMESPHNYYANSKGIGAAIASKGYTKTLRANYDPMFIFAEDGMDNELENGTACEAIQMYYFYNHPYLVYNADDQKYYKYEFGAAEMDALKGTQLAFDNIIIQECDYSMYEQTAYLNIEVTGKGKGKYITRGKMRDINWDRYSLDCHGSYTDAETGEQITLNQGKTLILIAQTDYAAQSKFYATKAEFDAAK